MYKHILWGNIYANLEGKSADMEKPRWAGEVAQGIKCLPCKSKDLSSNP